MLLSFSGKTLHALLHLFAGECLTLSHGFDAWETRRFAGRYDHKKCGRPHKLTEEEQEKAKEYITQQPQNRKQVVPVLAQATVKRLSTKTLKRLLKKTVISGNVCNTPQSSPRIRSPMSAGRP